MERGAGTEDPHEPIEHDVFFCCYVFCFHAVDLSMQWFPTCGSRPQMQPQVLGTGPLVVAFRVSLFNEPFHVDCFVAQHYCIRIQ